MILRRVHVQPELAFPNLGVLRDDHEGGLILVPTNGVFGLIPEGFVLDTDAEHGVLDLVVEYHDDRPTVELDDWEVVQEFSVGLGSEDYQLVGWRWFDDQLTFVNFAGENDYRVRAHVRGHWEHHFDAGQEDWDPDTEEPLEFWLLQLWVEPPTDDEFLRDDPRRRPFTPS